MPWPSPDSTEIGGSCAMSTLTGRGQRAKCHHHEIRRFSDLVGDELRFSACSYQTFFGHLKAVGRPEDEAYLTYLAERYFLAL